MLYSAYYLIVMEHLSVDAERRGLEDFRERMAKNALVDLQRFIRSYRVGHSTTYEAADLQEEEYGMIGNMPTEAVPEAFYTLSTELDDDGVAHPYCKRNRMDFWPWESRKTLLCSSCEQTLYAVAIAPYGNMFVIHPVVNDETQLLLVWEGIKSNFVDADTVLFPEQSAEAVAAYIKWRILLEIDKNPALAQQQFAIWSSKRLALYRDDQEKQDAQKPDQEYPTSIAPTAPAANW